MRNFSIDFTYPWVLLLILLAVVLTLIPYFRLSKKYRKTRNRITSIVLHLVVMVLCISVLAGIQFSYETPNVDNEIILLVDMSETEEQVQRNRDEFIETVLHDGQYDDYKIGIVTFGFDQVYAVPLTNEIDTIYPQYLTAPLPDSGATDIAAALNFAKEQFTSPQTGKIVLITDGKETDEEASTAIRSVAAREIRVDTVFIPSKYEGNNLQLIDVGLPDYHLTPDEDFEVSVTVQSDYSSTASLTISDNGATLVKTDVQVPTGTQLYRFKLNLSEQGMHELKFSISEAGDAVAKNNDYYSYIYMEEFNHILILERNAGESEALKALLTADDAFNVDIVNIKDDAALPATIDELREYDQVILNNIAYKDMPKVLDVDGKLIGYDEVLYSYVYDYGGGLFTVGGNDEQGNPNTYVRSDMYGTVYQQMLPVEAINYTPPVGVIVIIDRSGSMDASASNGETKLAWARAGADGCLQALTERDYFGLMTLDSDFSTVLPLTPRTQESKIRAAIDSINEANGGTEFPDAIERAGMALRAQTDVDKRHIIIVSDGEVPENQREDYLAHIKNFYENDGITTSVVIIGSLSGDAYDKMKEATEVGHGRLQVYADGDAEKVVAGMREELNVDEIKDYNPEKFQPNVYNTASTVVQGVDRYTYDTTDADGNPIQVTDITKLPEDAMLGGFYGAKVRDKQYSILTGDYEVPVYAQWKFGAGMVGSFMCDLNGGYNGMKSWSADFLASQSGSRFITNVVKNLLPVENIRPSEITVKLEEGNYLNKLSVFTANKLKDGEYIKGEIKSSNGEVIASMNSVGENTQGACYVMTALGESNNYSRCNFVVREGGIYTIELTKCDAEGNVLATFATYKQFSYSKEYDTFYENDEQKIIDDLTLLAFNGRGQLIEDNRNPVEVFEGFVTSVKKSYDPRLVFIIIAIVLMLLDIAVRKFKFKWPHEIIRDFKAKRAEAQNEAQTK